MSKKERKGRNDNSAFVSREKRVEDVSIYLVRVGCTFARARAKITHPWEFFFPHALFSFGILASHSFFIVRVVVTVCTEHSS